MFLTNPPNLKPMSFIKACLNMLKLIKEGVFMKKKPRSKYCRIVNTVSLILPICSLLFIIVYWPEIPDQIPSHYDELGKITSWSGKYSVLVMLLIYVLLYSLISFVERTPSIWNTIVTVTAKNREFVYSIIGMMITTSKFLMVCIFTYITVNMALARELSPLFALISLISLTVSFYSLSFGLLLETENSSNLP